MAFIVNAVIYAPLNICYLADMKSKQLKAKTLLNTSHFSYAKRTLTVCFSDLPFSQQFTRIFVVNIMTNSFYGHILSIINLFIMKLKNMSEFR